MSEATLIVEAKRKVDAALAECNRIARDIMTEATAFTKKDAERVLKVDITRLVTLTVADLTTAREDLADARAKYDELMRRA